MIQVRNLTKSYKVKHGRHYVFDGVNADFPEGSNIGIIGPNGCGKSTFLRIIGGIDHPDSGEINSSKSFSWPLGLKGGFVPHMSGRDNCRMVCNLYGLDHRFTRKKLEEIKERSCIGKYFEEPVKYYSSGMSGRLGFSLSMAFSFDYFLIDEITAVGDAHFKEMAKQALEEKARHSKVIMVTHSMGDIKKFCDIGVLLKDGQFRVFEDLDEAIRAYLPQTKTAEAELTELISQASVENIQLDDEALPKNVADAIHSTQQLLFSIESGLASPEHEITGDVADFYSQLGKAYQQLGAFKQAEAYHLKALEENDYLIGSQHALVRIHARNNNTTGESRAIEKAIAIDPHHLQNYLLKIRFLRKTGDFSAALQLAEKALKHHHEKPMVWAEYARCQYDLDRMDEAIEALARAVRLAEEAKASANQKSALHRQLSQMLSEKGNWVESAKASYKAKRLSNPPPEPGKRYENCLKILQNLDKRLRV